MAAGDLITLSYAQAALSELTLTTAQASFLPAAISAASALVVRECGDRDFVQQDYDRIFPLGLAGLVSLPQVPVLKVSRVAAGRTPAVTLMNTDPTTNQRATVEYQVSGDESIGITCTGIILTTKAAGVSTATPLAFSGSATLQALATAINATPGSWSATLASGYEQWGTDELISDDDTAQDTLSSATLDVWARDLAGLKMNKRTGILDVSRARVLGIDGPQWGPGWEIFDDEEREVYSHVRVIYTAGFVTVPLPVQLATAEVVYGIFSRLQTDPLLAAETDGEYSYTVDKVMAEAAIPPGAAAKLIPFTLYRT